MMVRLVKLDQVTAIKVTNLTQQIRSPRLKPLSAGINRISCRLTFTTTNKEWYKWDMMMIGSGRTVVVIKKSS